MIEILATVVLVLRLAAPLVLVATLPRGSIIVEVRKDGTIWMLAKAPA